jgi:hypothetical protein
MPRSLWLIVLFTSACNFETSTEEIFTEVPLPSIEGMDISLNDYPNQHIQLKKTTTFTYSINPGSKQFLQTRVTINGVLLWVSSHPYGNSFTIDPLGYGTGNHALRVEFTTKPQSGSLADNFDAEVLTLWTERVIEINNDVPKSPSDPGAISITSIENVNNSVKISWNAYTNFNFDHYELYREDYDESGKVVGGRNFGQLGVQDATSVFDNQYMGGKSAYKIGVFNAAGKSYIAPPYIYQHPYQPNLKTTFNPNGTITISWNSLQKLRNNFYQYQLDVRERYYDIATTITKNSVTDTTYTFTPTNVRFGNPGRLTLRTYPPSTDPYRTYHGSIRIGETFTSFNGPLMDPVVDASTGNYYLVKSGKLQIVNPDGQALDSLNGMYTTIRMNNSFAVVTTGYPDYGMYKVNLSTLEVESKLNIPSEYVRAVTNDNKIWTGTEIYNLDGTQIAVNVTSPATGGSIRAISPDGIYYYTNYWFFKYNGTSYEQWKPFLVSSMENISFYPNAPGKIIVGSPTQISQGDLEVPNSGVTTTAATGPCNYDAGTNLLGCHGNNKFVILDPVTLNVVKTLVCDTQNNSYYLINGTIICSGSKIKLSDIP